MSEPTIRYMRLKDVDAVSAIEQVVEEMTEVVEHCHYDHDLISTGFQSVCSGHQKSFDLFCSLYVGTDKIKLAQIRICCRPFECFFIAEPVSCK